MAEPTPARKIGIVSDRTAKSYDVDSMQSSIFCFDGEAGPAKWVKMLPLHGWVEGASASFCIVLKYSRTTPCACLEMRS
jgi:hypothetical protein